MSILTRLFNNKSNKNIRLTKKRGALLCLNSRSVAPRFRSGDVRRYAKGEIK